MVTRIGINGFGRIGRAIARQALGRSDVHLVAINDLDPDIGNHLYLLEFDSIYGRLFDLDIQAFTSHALINGLPTHFHSESRIENVDWSSHRIDILIDSTGSAECGRNSRRLIDEESCRFIVVTNASSEVCDRSIVVGANESELDIEKHKIISSSICDVNALAPLLKLIDKEFGIESGNLTTLHPWLQYQNLLDGSVASVSNSSHYWNDYALGRCAVTSLIPKSTTLLNALDQVVPGLSPRLDAMSLRTPLPTVAAAKGTLLLKDTTSLDEILNRVESLSLSHPGSIRVEDKNLVSIDYKADPWGGILDKRWLQLNKGKLLSFVLWYDNEWGYASKVYSLIDHITRNSSEIS